MLDKWMAEFHYLLTYNNAALAESDSEQESVVDVVKAAVCENLYLFIQINEDEFEKYLKTFAQDVWTELTKVSLNPGQVPCFPAHSASAGNISHAPLTLFIHRYCCRWRAGRCCCICSICSSRR